MIKKFKDFGLESITENARWGLSAVSPYGTGIHGANQPNNPSLTYDSWDQHVNNIINQQKDLLSIMKHFHGGGRPKGHGKEFERVSYLKILQQEINESLHIDLWVEFKFDEKETFDATLKNFDRFGYREIKTTADENLQKEEKVRLHKNLERILEEWYRPEKKKFELLKPEVRVWLQDGTPKILKKGVLLEVCRHKNHATNNKIILKEDDKYYELSGQDYYWFNWWFREQPNIELDL